MRNLKKIERTSSGETFLKLVCEFEGTFAKPNENFEETLGIDIKCFEVMGF